METIENRIKNILTKGDFSEYPMIPQKNLLIEVTNYCNNKCIFCANRKMTRKKEFINPVIVQKVLKECYELGTREVGFYATGEPLIDVKLEEYILLAKNIGYEYVYLTTNGILANPKRVDKLFQNGLDSLKFSINAINSEKYELIHGTDNFEVVVNNLKKAYSLKKEKYSNKKISVSYIMTKYSMECEKNIKKFFENISDEVIVDMAKNQGGLIEEIEYLGCDNNIKAPCYYVFNSINITCEGYITACCMDFQNYLAYADINKTSIKEAWKNECITNLRRNHLCNNLENTICNNCINSVFEKVKPLKKELSTKFYGYKLDLSNELISRRNLGMEKVDIYNKFREKTGNVKGRKELENGEYRISTHIWIKNQENKILIEKRSEKEDKFPGMWAQVGGGVKSGDTSKMTVFKECNEELNYDVKEENLFYIGSYIRTKDIVDVWMVNQDIDIDALELQEDEVAEVRLVTFEQFDEMIKDNKVVPSINPSYDLLKNFCNSYMK